jgi:branched-chain amino acid transport system ATP-binding protein
MGTHLIVRRGISIVPEGRRLFPKMTVGQNLEIGLYDDERERGRAESLARVYSLFPRLRERHEQTAGTLSGGEQAMLSRKGPDAAACSYILDEPSLRTRPVRWRSSTTRITASVRREPPFSTRAECGQGLSVADRGYVSIRG